MLVIAREVGEVITIGDDIQIEVVAVTGGMVRFGVTAPREIPVHRSEVYRRIKAREERERQR
ncbi:MULTISPECIES: carbon storage regulator CsrA [Pseudomonas]|uniref:Carbon storage regulator n=1 Tax=Pseudomonas hunanensis TaxID=1247546 RepID=A0ACC6K6I7_9PSED|nr:MULTISPECIES: carbon storage regulator CsrA [Pseudomonas]MBP2263724.1 carbon storage regulator [Pseudomonas sp. BP8]MDR6714104.1 carbon storage regulator [Pseudomonas hunanensis]HDS1737818.1 carbon storage regulator CsrA [Pseudomonas putida]